MLESQSRPARTVHLKDYRPPAFWTETVELRFVLEPSSTLVEARQTFRRNGEGPADLVLTGEGLETLRVALDGRDLAEGEYRIEGGELTVPGPPAAFTLATTVRIDPAANTRLMGLYISNGIFCTQCEAEGFRRITWFQDRPDVMARYRVRIEAEKARYPVLLSNGNPVAKGDLDGGRHFAEWDDPFPKPAYLFALVAGDLARIEDRFTTRSGREVTLHLYAEAPFIDQCRHAMESLRKSMRWDEERYGLEYDLDLFQIVAVSDFNFGAMENKGLNIFNTSACLARADTSTDADFTTVERIIAHEYFHNWTGDRVTCRDWFQLTLKEGLTVFRDQQFSADTHSAPVKRIGDVVLLRETQFPEDAGPLAHPIRPVSYVEINNFYTRTVYEKGAEVIRMMHTLVGEENFRKGMDLYFERHDGKAVTCEDFRQAIADAAGKDLSLFQRWYEQAGTPEVTVERRWDPQARTFELGLSQRTPPTPGQPEKLPVPIPVRMGLVGRESGRALPLQLDGENAPRGTTRVLELNEAQQRFTFVGLDEEPVPSLFRDFSAPVRVQAGLDRGELGVLMKHDPDPFGRWDAGQTLTAELLIEQIRAFRAGRPLELAPVLTDAYRTMLGGEVRDPAYLARALALPGRSFIAQQLPSIDVEALHGVFRFFQAGLGGALAEDWRRTYDAMTDTGPYSIETAAMGRRSLKNSALVHLLWGKVTGGEELALAQYRGATNMTDRLGALRALLEGESAESDSVLIDFYAAWQHEPLVVNKWFALQAGMEDEGSLERVERLTRHPAFTMTNPNRVRALLGTFAAGNLMGFHRADGAAYRFLADRIVALDRTNAQVAARLLTAFGRWRRFDERRQALMRAELERILAQPGLSRDCYEIASKSLG